VPAIVPSALSAAGLAVPVQEVKAAIIVKIRMMATVAFKIFLFLVNTFQNHILSLLLL
jgi:hypothetical protein